MKDVDYSVLARCVSAEIERDSLRGVAKKAGLATRTVRSWADGSSGATVDNMWKFARAFGLDFYEMVGLTNPYRSRYEEAVQLIRDMLDRRENEVRATEALADALSREIPEKEQQPARQRPKSAG